MSTQGYNNRQDVTPFTLPADGSAIDVLATAQGVNNDYQEGMGVNGGFYLNLEVNNLSVSDVALVGYRRLTNTSAWSSFFTGTATVAVPAYSVKIAGVGGFADVRITAAGAGAVTQDVVVSATITVL